MSIGGGKRLLVAGLLLASLLLACNDDPAVAPLIGGHGTLIELGFVAGELAPPVGAIGSGVGAGAAGAATECPSPESGFGEDVVAYLTVTPASGSVIERELAIPAHTETSGIQVDGLTPGGGYHFEVVIDRSSDGEQIFTGEVEDQQIRPGAREIVRIDLVPVGRRAVLGIGQARTTAPDEIVVPIYLSQSLQLRGVQFDLCFDNQLLEVTGLQAVGRLTDFDGLAGGESTPDAPYRVVLWSTDHSRRIPPGQDAVVEVSMRFLPGNEGTTDAALIFTDSIITDQAEPGQNFVVYYFDGRVTR